MNPSPRTTLNVTLVIAFVVLTLFQLYGFPLTRTSPLSVIALAVSVLTTNTLWALIHEGIHTKLSHNTKQSDLLARVASICLGTPFRGVQTAHLMHHRYSRTEHERHEYYDPERVVPLAARFSYYFRLFFGVYLQEILLPVLMLLPRNALKAFVNRKYAEGSYGRIIADAFLKKDKWLMETRVDFVAILLLYGSAFYVYGNNWYQLALLLAARGFCISFLDYIYHYGTQLDSIAFATNLSLPRALSSFVLNFNYHGVHHLSPSTPWHALPDEFARKGKEFDGGFLQGALAQLRGPVALAPKDERLTTSEEGKMRARISVSVPDDKSLRTRLRKFVDALDKSIDFTSKDIEEALNSKAVRLLGREKQLCVASELYNYVVTEADVERALPYIESSTVILLFFAHSFRRQKAVDGLFKSVQHNVAFSELTKEAFCLQTSYHEMVLRDAVRQNKLTREKAIFCCFNGVALNKEIGKQVVSVPISFQSQDDIYVRNKMDTLFEIGSHVRFEQIYEVDSAKHPFKMKVSNAVELWRATTFTKKEPETVQWLDDTIEEDSVFYDVGANIGVYSLYALSAHKDVRAVCFEPDALNFARLNENIFLNGAGERAVSYAVGLSDENKITRFHSSKFVTGKAENWCAGHNSRGDDNERGAMVTGCPLFSLDRFMDEQSDLPAPTHLKIDVDGPEVKILKGATKTLALPSLRHILIEIFDAEVEEVTTILASYGFKRVGGRRHSLVPEAKGHMGNHIFRR